MCCGFLKKRELNHFEASFCKEELLLVLAEMESFLYLYKQEAQLIRMGAG